jgi:hypothetical protein
MFRRLFAFASIFSLLMSIGMACLWIRSYYRAEEFGHVSLHAEKDSNYLHFYRLYLKRGSLGVSRTIASTMMIDLRFFSTNKYGFAHTFGRPNDLVTIGDIATPTKRFGFERYGGSVLPWHLTTRGWIIVVPLWFPMALMLVFPGIWIWRWRRLRQRNRVGKCPVCGYDMRATPERCPECGKTVASGAGAAVVA